MTGIKAWLNERPGEKTAEIEAQAAVELASRPFDPRTQVSADAKYIVRRLVFWFLVVPLALALFVWIITH
jgi:hypothetical protein